LPPNETDDLDLDLDPPEDADVGSPGDGPGTGSDDLDTDIQDNQGDDQASDDDLPEAARSADGDGDDRSSRQSSRGERRHQALSNRLQDMERRNSDLERRLNESLARQTGPRQETNEERESRLALLTPEERMQVRMTDAEQRHGQQLFSLQMQLKDGQDRTSFEAKAFNDPLYKRWAPKVEAELAALRTQGQTVDREKLLYYLIGKAAVEARTPGRKQQRQAQQRLQRANSRPANNRSDTGSSRRTQASSLEKRLEDVPL
jgi:hypothetical protein